MYLSNAATIAKIPSNARPHRLLRALVCGEFNRVLYNADAIMYPLFC